MENKCDKCEEGKCTCDSKPLEQKNIIEKYTNKEGKFRLDLALQELDIKNKEYKERIAALEEAMMFFSEWYNKTQRVDILVPESLKKELDGEQSKIIL